MKIMEEYEAIVVGGGPAGIFATYTMLEKGTKGSELCLIEKGLSAKERNDYSIEGFGGAGLFSDVKLCMRFDTGSIVPEIYLEDIVNRFEEDKIFRENILKKIEFAKSANYKQILYSYLHAKACEPLIEYFEKVKEIFSDFCKRIGIEKDFYNLYKNDKDFKVNLESILREENLDISSYYPVIHLGSDQGRKVTEEFERYFKRNGVELKFNTEIKSITKNREEFELIDSRGNIYNSNKLILACGKRGSNWMINQLKNLSAEIIEGKTWIGVRVETKKNELSELTKHFGDDPKIKWPLIRKSLYDDWAIKLHCFVEGGKVISYPWKNITLVGGTSDSKRSGKNTNFDVLYSDSSLTSKYIKERSKKFEENLKTPTIQRFDDYLRNIPTKNLSKNSVSPTLKNYKTGNVREFLSNFSKNFAEKLPVFMEKISRLYKEITDPDTLIYFPVIEWGSERVKVNTNMETNVKNLYTIGDSAGITQGIVASALTGIIAGNDIVRKR